MPVSAALVVVVVVCCWVLSLAGLRAYGRRVVARAMAEAQVERAGGTYELAVPVSVGPLLVALILPVAATFAAIAFF